MMTVAITKRPLENEVSGAWDPADIQNFYFHSINASKQSTVTIFLEIGPAFKNPDFAHGS